MITGATLKTNTRRKVLIEGEPLKFSADKCAIVLEKYHLDIVDGGGIAQLVSEATLEVADRIVTVEPNPRMYAYGMVQGQRIYTKDDGCNQIVFIIKLHDETVLPENLDWLCRLYVDDRV